MVEMAPPDVTSALAADAIDAFVMGEPFPSQAEMGGYGRVLFQAREYWPDYMSCILVVRQDLIDTRPEVVQVLVDGIARSGLWLDKSKPHREDAADFVGRFYYNQKPALLRWALTKPMDRVTYSPLAPRKADFDMVRDLMIETGVLKKKLEFRGLHRHALLRTMQAPKRRGGTNPVQPGLNDNLRMQRQQPSRIRSSGNRHINVR